MRLALAFAMLWSLCPPAAAGEQWERLDGPAIGAALAARVLGYPDGALQDFFADGRTLHDDSPGRWEVRGDRYCSVWPPSDRWTCHVVDRSGLQIRFTDDRGNTTIGRYVDLQ